ncbi:MAG: hypothetical protein JJ974_08110 [Phycisphaerales bacterium]|nr:hypothetical protein [Phycisphaerales bacterium]
MTGDAPEPAEQTTLVCSECGGDVCETRSTKRNWTHRSRMIPRLVWIALCLGLIGYWVSIGYIENVRGYTRPVGLHQQQSTRVATTLNPSYRADIHPTFVSTQDLRDAIQGDADAMNTVREKITEAHLFTQSSGSNMPVESVRFGWKETLGSYTTSRSYQFGGSLWSVYQSVKLQDVRDRSSIGHDQYRWSWGDGGWTFFPQLGEQTITQDGAVNDAWSINLLNIFRLFSMCLVIGYVLSSAGKLLRVPLLRTKHTCVILMMALFCSAFVYTAFTPRDFDRVSGSMMQDSFQSEVYLVDELNTVVADDAHLIQLCEDLLALITPNESNELLLSQAWTYKKSQQQWARPTTDSFGFGISRFAQVLRYEKRSYKDRGVDEQIPEMYQQPLWKSIHGSGNLGFQWGPIDSQKSLRVDLFTIVSIAVLFWFIWRICHWSARAVLRRVQKRRVLRNQCIFCSYPLSAQAVNARYPRETT